MYTRNVNTFYFYHSTIFDRRTVLDNKGILKIHLSNLLKASGMSKNKFCQKAEIQRSQLKGYMDNTITRLDTDVLIRICHTLDCSIADLLEYVPPEQIEK